MPRPSAEPPVWATDANYPASVYPATLADGVTPHPLAGTPTPWSAATTRLTTGLAAFAAAGWIPGVGVAANRFNAWLGQESEWSQWLRDEVRNWLDESSLNSNTELRTALNRIHEEICGDGSDLLALSTVPAGTTSLTRDTYCDDLTIQAGGTLRTNGYRLFVRGRLTIEATGVLTPGTTAAGVGPGSIGEGGAGGDASAGDTTARRGESLTAALGGAGGQGAGGTGGNATGGTVTAPTANAGGFRSLSDLLRGRTANGTVLNGGGGGGAGWSTDPTARPLGGGGGGVLILAAFEIDNAGEIHADGQNGPNGISVGGSPASHGAGGGGGGAILMAYGRPVGAGLGTVRANGGTGGTGVNGGSNGSSGSSSSTSIVIMRLR